MKRFLPHIAFVIVLVATLLAIVLTQIALREHQHAAERAAKATWHSSTAVVADVIGGDFTDYQRRSLKVILSYRDWSNNSRQEPADTYGPIEVGQKVNVWVRNDGEICPEWQDFACVPHAPSHAGFAAGRYTADWTFGTCATLVLVLGFLLAMGCFWLMDRLISPRPTSVNLSPAE